MKDNFEIVHDFYDRIFADDTEKVKDLLVGNTWLQKVLQPSLLADMQFYNYDKVERKYKLYLPKKEMLDLLKENLLDIEKSINTKIEYSADVIRDNASYMSSSMQNKNAVECEYKKGETFKDLAEKHRPNYYSFEKAQNDDVMRLLPQEERNLQTVGRSWFVSRMYYEYIDKHHTKWTLTPTDYKRGTFNKIQNQHETLVKYLYSIMNSNEIRLDKNEIGLPGAKIKEMAKDLLEKIVSGEIKFNLSDEIKKKAKELLEKIKNAYIEKNTENDIGYTDKHLFDTDTDGISWELTPKEERDLQTIGKSWFVSRMYHDFIDRSHNNWELTPTGFKMGTFQKITRITQKKYLQNILKSNVTMLGKNQIGLSGTEVLRMAQELLDRLKEVSV